jgi:plasmid stability protein
MANLQIKNVPDHIHAELRRRAALEHLTIRDYVLRLIERDQMQMAGEEWLRLLHELEPVSLEQSAADGIAEDRAEREAHLDRVHEEYLERVRAAEHSQAKRSA